VDLFASNADWISPNGDLNNPPAADGRKVIVADTDHLCGICGNRSWVWKSFTRGENPLFMDQYDDSYKLNGGGYDLNNPNDVSLRRNLGYTLSYANRIDLTKMTPHGELASSGFALANPAPTGAEYLVYLPQGSTVANIYNGKAAANILNFLDINRRPAIYLPTDSSVTVDLSATSGELIVEWFNPSNGITIDGGTVTGGANRHLTAPFTGDAVLYLYQPRGLTISNVSVHPMDFYATVTWNTDTPATSQVEYGTSPSLGTVTTQTATDQTSHSVTLFGLSPETEYNYKVRSENMNGQSTESAIASFTTLNPEDVQRSFMPFLAK
jgi:hypothetical protein